MRLLLVGYHFLRTQSAGGHRLQAMVKYLSRMGWETTVLTVRASVVGVKGTEEKTVFSNIPQATEVVRTGSFEVPWIWGGHGRQKGGEARELGSSNSGSRGQRRSERGKQVLGWWKIPARWIRGIISFPDRQAGWVVPLAKSAWGLLRDRSYDVVLTSGPPHSSHLPFLLLRRRHRFLWVCDFRDPWTDPPFYAVDTRTLRTQRVRLFFNRMLERRVLGSCDRILANTIGNGEALHRSFGPLVEGKVTVLTNGYDEEAAIGEDGVQEWVKGADFVFTGEVYRWMLDLYLDALEVLRERRQRLPVLHIVGAADDGLRARVSGMNLDEHVRFMGTVSYEGSLRILREAKALLLLFIGHHDLFRLSVPSKMYAYLHSGRPYLALVPEGDAARVLEEVGGGRVVKSRDPEEVAEQIASFLDMMDSGTVAADRNQDALMRYSWSSLSADLDRLLRGEIAGSRAVQ